MEWGTLLVLAITALGIFAGGYAIGRVRSDEAAGSRRIPLAPFDLGPHDKVIFATERELSREDYERFRAAFDEAMANSSRRGLVLPRGMAVDAVLRSAAGADSAAQAKVGQ